MTLVAQLKKYEQRLIELNRPQKRIQKIRTAIQSIVAYEKLIEQNPELQDLYLEQIDLIRKSIFNK